MILRVFSNLNNPTSLQLAHSSSFMSCCLPARSPCPLLGYCMKDGQSRDAANARGWLSLCSLSSVQLSTSIFLPQGQSYKRKVQLGVVCHKLSKAGKRFSPTPSPKDHWLISVLRIQGSAFPRPLCLSLFITHIWLICIHQCVKPPCACQCCVPPVYAGIFRDDPVSSALLNSNLGPFMLS